MTLTVAITPNPRLQPVIDGEVTADGLQLDIEVCNPAQIHSKVITENTHDVFEFSLSGYLAHRDHPAPGLEWTALPLFLSRPLLIFNLQSNVASGLTSLADLRGKRVGVPDFGMTAAIWLRILLRHEYGIEPHEIEWVNGRPQGERHTDLLGSCTAPAGVTVAPVIEGMTFSDMLHAGEMQAAFGDRQTAAIKPGPKIRPLLDPERSRDVFVSFCRNSGVLPTSHAVLVQQRLDKDIVASLYNLLERSKLRSYENARRAAAAYLLFPDDAFDAQARVFGNDPYPSGLDTNQQMVELLASQMLDEGSISAIPDVRSLFAVPVAAAISPDDLQ